MTVPKPVRDSTGRDFCSQRSVIHTSLGIVYRIGTIASSENNFLMIALILDGKEEEKVMKKKTDMGMEEKANRREILLQIVFLYPVSMYFA